MIRLATLVALGALVAAPASAEVIHVSTVGKSPAQVRAEIYQAASKACSKAVLDGDVSSYQRGACVQGAVLEALARTAGSATVQTAAR